MPAHLENSAEATGLEKISFHSNPKEGQCQRMLKLLHNCTHFTCQQGYAQNPSSQALAVHELRTSRCISWVQKRLRNQRSNCQHLLDHRESKEIPEKNTYFGFIDSTLTLQPLTVQNNTIWKILKEIGISNHLTYLLRNLYAGQEASQNWTGNNRLVQDWERNMSKLCIITLFI